MDLGTPDEPKAYIWLAIVCLSLQRHTHRTPRPPRQDGRVWCRDAPLTDPVCVPLARPSPSGSRPGSLHNGSCPPEQSRRDDLRSATPSLPHTSPCPPSPGVSPMESTLILEGSSIHGASMPAIDTRTVLMRVQYGKSTGVWEPLC